MTSTISSEKQTSEFKQGKAIYLWTLRKNLKLLIAYVIMLVISLPVVQLIFGRLDDAFEAEASEQLNFVRGTYSSVFSAFAVIFTLICGAVLFSYMHSKRGIDLFASLPAKRTTQFFARFLSAFTLSWVPMTAVTLISALICAIYTPKGLPMIANGFVWLTVSMLVNLSMVAFLAVCAGNVTDVIFSYLAISAAWPLITLVFYFLPNEVIPGNMSIAAISPMVISALSPFLSSFIGSFYYLPFIYIGKDYNIIEQLSDSDKQGWGYIAWWIALTVVLLIACALLIKRRKNECAQTSFAFSSPLIVIRVLCNFISGVGVGLLFALFSSDLGNVSQLIWFCVGAILGSFAAHIILQLIYRQRFSGFARSLVYYGISTAAALAFAFAIVTGWFGSDVYVPKAAEVDSVTCYFNISYDDYTEDEHKNFTSNTIEIDDKQEIEKILSLHGAITDSFSTSDPKPYSITGARRYNDADPVNEEMTVYLEYSIGGRIVTRNYRIKLDPDGEVKKALNEVFDATDIIRKTLGLYQLKGAPYYDESSSPISVDINIDSPRLEEYLRENEPNEDDEAFLYVYGSYFTTEQRTRITEALRKDLDEKDDLLRYVFDYYNGNQPCISLSYSYNGYDDSLRVEQVAIDKSFKNTVAELKNCGVDMDLIGSGSLKTYKTDMKK